MRDLGFNLNLGVMVNTHSFYSYTSDVDRAARIGETITKRYAANRVFTGYQYFPGGADYTVPGMKLDASKASSWTMMVAYLLSSSMRRVTNIL